MSTITFNDICNYLAARHCVAAGQPIKQMAKSAKRSPSTIRRWLKETEHIKHRLKR